MPTVGDTSTCGTAHLAAGPAPPARTEPALRRRESPSLPSREARPRSQHSRLHVLGHGRRRTARLACIAGGPESLADGPRSPGRRRGRPRTARPAPPASSRPPARPAAGAGSTSHQPPTKPPVVFTGVNAGDGDGSAPDAGARPDGPATSATAAPRAHAPERRRELVDCRPPRRSRSPSLSPDSARPHASARSVSSIPVFQTSRSHWFRPGRSRGRPVRSEDSRFGTGPTALGALPTGYLERPVGGVAAGGANAAPDWEGTR